MKLHEFHYLLYIGCGVELDKRDIFTRRSNQPKVRANVERRNRRCRNRPRRRRQCKERPRVAGYNSTSFDVSITHHAKMDLNKK